MELAKAFSVSTVARLRARSESDVIRSGCDEARVDLRFDVVTTDGAIEERVLSRVVPREGRSRAYIDGRPSTAHALAELAASAIEIHGQHEQHRLGNARVRSDLLDLFGGLSHQRPIDAQVGSQRSARKSLPWEETPPSVNANSTFLNTS